MLSVFAVSLALALGALGSEGADKVENQPIQSEQSSSVSKRLSSDEIARIRTGSGVPSNCEVFWLPDPITGELSCGAVVCRDSSGVPEIFDCSEFGL
jgi:hypothetical protein